MSFWFEIVVWKGEKQTLEIFKLHSSECFENHPPLNTRKIVHSMVIRHTIYSSFPIDNFLRMRIMATLQYMTTQRSSAINPTRAISLAIIAPTLFTGPTRIIFAGTLLFFDTKIRRPLFSINSDWILWNYQFMTRVDRNDSWMNINKCHEALPCIIPYSGHIH